MQPSDFVSASQINKFQAPSPREGYMCDTVFPSDPAVGLGDYVVSEILKTHSEELIKLAEKFVFVAALHDNEKRAIEALNFLSSLHKLSFGKIAGYTQLRFIKYLRMMYFAVTFIERTYLHEKHPEFCREYCTPTDVPLHEFKGTVMRLIVNVWTLNSGTLAKTADVQALAAEAEGYILDIANESRYLSAAKFDWLCHFGGSGKCVSDVQYLQTDWETAQLAKTLRESSAYFLDKGKNEVGGQEIMNAAIKLSEIPGLLDPISEIASVIAVKFGAKVCRPGDPAKKSSKSAVK